MTSSAHSAGLTMPGLDAAKRAEQDDGARDHQPGEPDKLAPEPGVEEFIMLGEKGDSGEPTGVDGEYRGNHR